MRVEEGGVPDPPEWVTHLGGVIGTPHSKTGANFRTPRLVERGRTGATNRKTRVAGRSCLTEGRSGAGVGGVTPTDNPLLPGHYLSKFPSSFDGRRPGGPESMETRQTRCLPTSLGDPGICLPTPIPVLRPFPYPLSGHTTVNIVPIGEFWCAPSTI